MWPFVKAYIKKKYHIDPDFPFREDLETAVFRHKDNNKWFALVMDVRASSLGLSGEEKLPVINLKIDDPMYRDILLRLDGILPAYHMNKMHWITALLDGSVPEERLRELIDTSFQATASAKKKQKLRPTKEWIVPANPKFYDVEGAFARSSVVDWKQGAGIRAGDTVYLYVAAPVSAILYRCRVTETDIPYRYADENLTIKALMKLRTERRYAPEEFPFERLRKEFNITAVRGPRSVPNSLSSALKKAGKKEQEGSDR